MPYYNLKKIENIENELIGGTAHSPEVQSNKETGQRGLRARLESDRQENPTDNGA